MSATAEHGLTAPSIKGALRRRPPQGVLRARAILYGIIAMTLSVAGLLLIAGWASLVWWARPGASG